MTRRPTPAKIKRQAPEPRIRLTELWRCADGHDFGFDPDRCKDAPRYCPYVVGQAPNGKWRCCDAAVARVKAAGFVR